MAIFVPDTVSSVQAIALSVSFKHAKRWGVNPLAKQQTTGDWLLLVSLITLWSTSFIFIELSLDSFSAVGIVAVRVLLGAIVLSSVLVYKRLKLPTNIKSWGVLVVFGTFGTTLPFFLISVGQQSITSGMAGLLMAVMPLVTMIIAHYWVPEESLNRYKLLGFCLGITGVAIVLYPAISSSSNAAIGIFIVLLASTSYGLNSVLVRLLPRFDPIVAGAGTLLASSAVMVPLWLIQDMPWQQSYSLSALWSLIWLGVGPTALAMLLYFIIIARAGPTFLANINYMIPVFAYFAGALLLGEVIEISALAALVLIIGGVAVTRYEKR